MKKIFMASAVLMGSLTLVACDSNNEVVETEAVDNTRVVDRDSVATEYEVTETVVEYDTTTRTKTVDADVEIEEE